jgi:hypothetical protein
MLVRLKYASHLPRAGIAGVGGPAGLEVAGVQAGEWARLTRRRLLAATSLLAIAAPALTTARPFAGGEPFSDGSLFADDGTGWVA